MFAGDGASEVQKGGEEWRELGVLCVCENCEKANQQINTS